MLEVPELAELPGHDRTKGRNPSGRPLAPSSKGTQPLIHVSPPELTQISPQKRALAGDRFLHLQSRRLHVRKTRAKSVVFRKDCARSGHGGMVRTSCSGSVLAVNGDRDGGAQSRGER